MSLLASVLALSLTAGVSPATAVVVVGQIPPAPQPFTCDNGFDRVQPTVTSGNSYVVPGDGTITGWSTYAGSQLTQGLKMKVFRTVGGQAASFSAVGQDGPKPLVLNTINSFPTNIAVQAGDVLGLNVVTGAPNCGFSVPGDNGHFALFNGGDLAIGQSGPFVPSYPNSRLNIIASLVPSNALDLSAAVARNKKKGTATLTVDVPGPGQLDYSGTGATLAGAAAVKTVTAAGPVKFLVRAIGKNRKKLRKKGKVRVTATFTFTPTGGATGTQTTTVTLKRN